MSTPVLPLVGAILLCAKTEELAEVEVVIGTHFKKVRNVQSGYTTYQLTDRTADDPGEVLILATHNKMGNVAAASATGSLASEFNPNLIVFVGTGGSLRPDKCVIGDVVVPQNGVSTKFYNRLEDAGRFGWFRQPPWVSALSADLRAYTRDGQAYGLRRETDTVPLLGFGQSIVARALNDQAHGNHGLGTGLKCGPSKRQPTVHVDAEVFSWDLVLASDHYRKLLTGQINPKAMVVDMESYGFLTTARMLNQATARKALSTVIVRGISDECGNKSTSTVNGYNNLAMQNAANVACRILRAGYLNS